MSEEGESDHETVEDVIIDNENSNKERADVCAQINQRLENYEKNNTLSKTVLEESLVELREYLELHPDGVEVRFGIAYVCGHLDLYDDGLAEIAKLEEMGVEDERIVEMKDNLLAMKAGANDGEEELEDTLVSVDKLVYQGEITPQFEAALTEIFKRFDKDGDEALNPLELDRFHHVVNSTPIAPQTIQFLYNTFDVNSKGHLTWGGFIGFYMSQTIGDPEETWKDLGNLGYNHQLVLINRK